MKTNIHLMTAVLFGMMTAGCSNSNLQVGDLRTEGLADPLGIDRVHPQLSWIITSAEQGEKQTAYRVLVASSRENIEQDRGDLWDSQKVDADQSVDVLYQGSPLETGTEAFWKVKVWDAGGRSSAWSPVAMWTMGMLKEDDWQARWIGLDRAVGTDRPDDEHRVLSARYPRKEFSVE